MILLRWSVLFTLRAMPAFPKCNVLNGMTGVQNLPISLTHLSLLMQSLYMSLYLFMQGHINSSCHVCHTYFIILCVLVRSLFWQPICWPCYTSMFPAVYICLGGEIPQVLKFLISIEVIVLLTSIYRHFIFLVLFRCHKCFKICQQWSLDSIASLIQFPRGLSCSA